MTIEGFRPWGFGGPGMGGSGFAFADKIRSISDEDYASFK